MTEPKNEEEIQAEKESTKIADGKEGPRISALNYIELSLADPNYGDARRDALALAALAASIGRAKRVK